MEPSKIGGARVRDCRTSLCEKWLFISSQWYYLTYEVKTLRSSSTSPTRYFGYFSRWYVLEYSTVVACSVTRTCVYQVPMRVFFFSFPLDFSRRRRLSSAFFWQCGARPFQKSHFDFDWNRWWLRLCCIKRVASEQEKKALYCGGSVFITVAITRYHTEKIKIANGSCWYKSRLFASHTYIDISTQR